MTDAEAEYFECNPSAAIEEIKKLRASFARERERCAEIADEYGKRAMAATPSAQEAAAAASGIAREIRAARS